MAAIVNDSMPMLVIFTQISKQLEFGLCYRRNAYSYFRICTCLKVQLTLKLCMTEKCNMHFVYLTYFLPKNNGLVYVLLGRMVSV